MDQATLSPPEGYKDGGLIDSALSGALGNHVFGAQHIQQLQVIQRLQQQRAAMLAARAAAANATSQPATVAADQQSASVCTECAECAECAAAKLAELEAGELIIELETKLSSLGGIFLRHGKSPPRRDAMSDELIINSDNVVHNFHNQTHNLYSSTLGGYLFLIYP